MAIILPAIILLFSLGLHRGKQLHSPVLRRLLLFFFPKRRIRLIYVQMVAKNKGANESLKHFGVEWVALTCHRNQLN